ncbi:uncharacterized protein BX663DRAFT_487149 [Cokeromyces recurvatus]|uniref:uncharacterized protein n=1 Tax=Cokeromyces recurvatus TaxID=90255 RepID=UPI00221F8B6C|nr:uncharacterized protein BX663DRAFT_487149 [Cokeromyces recurvatus]KAI7901866.1 hypothetical protein BX663DRAFT_487149 [Cokeromyces recurvatus]
MNDITIDFPPSTLSSKLSSKLLKKPPSPVDWIQQSYMEMIQDASFATGYHHESLMNKNSLDLLVNLKHIPYMSHNKMNNDNKKLNTCINNNNPTHHTQQPDFQCEKFSGRATSSIYTDKTNTNNNITSLSSHDISTTEICTSNNDNDTDTDTDICNTFTTSSTDCNRMNNVFRIYKEQQSYVSRPTVEDESSFIKVAAPNNRNNHIKGGITINTKVKSKDGDTLDKVASPCRQTTRNNIQTSKISHKNKKRLKSLRNLFSKMRKTAEKPFWIIDNCF